MPPIRTTGRNPQAHALRNTQIIAAVRELASEGGFEAIQMREVAKRAGIALATLYRYHPSKDDLVRAAVREQVQMLRADVLARPPIANTAGARAASVYVRAFHAMARDRGFAHAAMNRYQSPRPFDAEPMVRDEQERTGLVHIAALAAWGPDHEITDDEYTTLHVLESLLNSSVVLWLGGGLTAESVEHRLLFTAERLIPER